MYQKVVLTKSAVRRCSGTVDSPRKLPSSLCAVDHRHWPSGTIDPCTSRDVQSSDRLVISCDNSLHRLPSDMVCIPIDVDMIDHVSFARKSKVHVLGAILRVKTMKCDLSQQATSDANISLKVSA